MWSEPGLRGCRRREVLSDAGWAVTVVEALGSPGRKFLRAGVGGLNLTHSPAVRDLSSAYGGDRSRLEPFLRRFGPAELQTWARGLGDRFVHGNFGPDFFPRGWAPRPCWTLGDPVVCPRRRLQDQDLWRGWKSDREWEFDDETGRLVLEADAGVLALGGPTWPALGTGGSWVGLLEARGDRTGPLAPRPMWG